MKTNLITYAKGLVWQYFQTEWNTKLVVWLGWAPGLPSPAHDDAQILANWGFDLIRPDYYGHARSEGIFSPQNCIQTAYDTIQTFSERLSTISIYTPTEIIPSVYEEIVVVGSSFWGRVTAIMPKFDEKIKEIVLLYPRFAPDNANRLGNPEETDEDLIRQYSLQKNIYRFAPEGDPYDAFCQINGFNSEEDASHLSDTKIFVWHGSADDVVWCGRSRQLVDKLRQENPQGKYHYAEYYGLWHGGLTKEASLRGWLHRRKQFE